MKLAHINLIPYGCKRNNIAVSKGKTNEEVRQRNKQAERRRSRESHQYYERKQGDA